MLRSELRIVDPSVLVLLGSTPTKALIERLFTLTSSRGDWFESQLGVPALATYHPAYLLRLRGDDYEQTRELVSKTWVRLARPPSILQEGVTLARVGAAALSAALTGAVLLLLRSSHPPTGATTLIVSLGLLQTPREMVMLMVGVVLLTVAGWIINRALGVPMPAWSAEG